jgi:uncharacterized membrane protein YjjP (DUF1212 family)
VTIETTKLGPLLLDIGTALIRAGASSDKIKLTLLAIAHAYHCELNLDLRAKSISLTLRSNNDLKSFNGIRSTDSYGVNFKIIEGINRLSQTVAINPLSMEQLRDEVNQVLKSSHYPRYLVLTMVGLAGAAFCFTVGGSLVEMGIAFGATFFGLFVKQECTSRAMNAYLCTYLAALAATTVIGLLYKLGVTERLEYAFTTSVLFLIPGVPLINCFTDLLEGEILNGLERGVNALIHALTIALGLTTTLYLFNFQG